MFSTSPLQLALIPHHHALHQCSTATPHHWNIASHHCNTTTPQQYIITSQHRLTAALKHCNTTSLKYLILSALHIQLHVDLYSWLVVIYANNLNLKSKTKPASSTTQVSTWHCEHFRTWMLQSAKIFRDWTSYVLQNPRTDPMKEST